DIIKKGKTAKGILAYELENENNVTLKATKGVGGKELGKKEINLYKLKTIDYSLTEDIVNEFNNSDNPNKTPTCNNTK
ncbi:DUF5067 domain-containing protein, partial [Staphylococcus felis]|nr:DUF5067 domain-containing protein [Staphylococcus felis]